MKNEKKKKSVTIIILLILVVFPSQVVFLIHLKDHITK